MSCWKLRQLRPCWCGSGTACSSAPWSISTSPGGRRCTGTQEGPRSLRKDNSMSTQERHGERSERHAPRLHWQLVMLIPWPCVIPEFDCVGHDFEQEHKRRVSQDHGGWQCAQTWHGKLPMRTFHCEVEQAVGAVPSLPWKEKGRRAHEQHTSSMSAERCTARSGLCGRERTDRVARGGLADRRARRRLRMDLQKDQSCRQG